VLFQFDSVVTSDRLAPIGQRTVAPAPLLHRLTSTSL